jgi:hypothetical protein
MILIKPEKMRKDRRTWHTSHRRGELQKEKVYDRTRIKGSREYHGGTGSKEGEVNGE